MLTQPQHRFLRRQARAASAIHQPASKSCDFTKQRMQHPFPWCDSIHWFCPVLPVLACFVDRTLRCCVVLDSRISNYSNNAPPVNLETLTL